MKTLAQDLFLSRIKEGLLDEPLNVVFKLKKLFLDNVEDFEITKSTFNFIVPL